jgi:hypothetical protein
MSAHDHDGWVVIVGDGAFASCYGAFASYDAVEVWLSANGWKPADCEIRAIRPAAGSVIRQLREALAASEARQQELREKQHHRNVGTD